MNDIFISAKIILDWILIIFCLLMFIEVVSKATSRKRRIQLSLIIISIVIFLLLTKDN